MFKFKPGNIWSGAKNGLAVLTNPTEIAFKKGNLKKHYPVVYNGRTYRDSEAFYKAKSRDVKPNTKRCYQICSCAISLKLKQHPEIFETIKLSGGVAFLEKCSHKVYNKSRRWEGNGRDSGYIRCLINAYELAIGERQVHNAEMSDMQ